MEKLDGHNVLIKTQNLSKIYKVGTIEIPALKCINLEIRENEFVALIGASGSGKSTLMNLVGCLDTPTEGHYFFKGFDVKNLTEDGLASIRNEEIGFVFQSFNLIPRMSALENVSVPLIYAGIKRNERLEIAYERLKDVGLEDRVGHKPNELSGGQKQRVAIARSLVNNPSIILADEPTGNLDSKSSEDILKVFSDIHSRGNTVILVTHEIDIAHKARRMIRLKDGEVEFDKLLA